MKNISIGNVKLTYLNQKPDTSYSDGESEDFLLDIFSSKDADKKISELLSKETPWPVYYHISPKRGTLISWYNFPAQSSVLEIGAGCGAITETLVSKDVKITALELTEKRSLINANRNKNASNLEIIIGNLENYTTNKKFDFVVCVGVLEYAGSFVNGEKPYEKFLIKIKSLLNPGGKLILAIENRMGLKYLAGAKEDHTGNYFDGINGYPLKKKVQTFGRIELESLIYSSGFINTKFYYPFPDYKMPTIIYSDDYMPGIDCDFPINLLPVDAPDQKRQLLFSEQTAMYYIEKNKLFSQFSNSFLVEIS